MEGKEKFRKYVKRNYPGDPSNRSHDSMNTNYFPYNKSASFNRHKKFKSSHWQEQRSYTNSRNSQHEFWKAMARNDNATEPSCSFNGQNSYSGGICDQYLQESVIRNQLSPLEVKITKLIDAVQSQGGVKGQLVFLQTQLDNPVMILQNALHTISATLVLDRNDGGGYQLMINGGKFAEGCFANKQIAKQVLSETVLNDLKKSCFYIIKKKNYEEISTQELNKQEVESPDILRGSKAHIMMLKMGWKGEGLGAREQGETKSLAESITQNVTREGLGGKNVMAEIDRVLEEFAKSIRKVTTLAFDASFTKEERAHVHLIASKYHLKSKSEGRNENRRITISKKIPKWELVKELLLVGGENNSYKLLVPSEFEDMWLNE